MGFPQLVMVVDDEHMIEQMIEAHLKKKGYEHVSFHDALAAMEFFRDNYDNIGLAIIDLTMPALNGDEMAARMRVLSSQTAYHKNMTGHLDIQNIDHNVNMFLSKPVESETSSRQSTS